MGHEVPPQRWVMEDRQQTPHGFLAAIGSPHFLEQIQMFSIHA